MVVDWESLPRMGAMRPGATRRAVAAELSSVVRVATASDAVFDDRSYHRHANEQWLIVIRGAVRLKRGDQEFEAHAGDLVFFPPDIYHCAVGVGPDGCEYYEIFVPGRYDQLPGYVGRSPLEFKQPT
jgi:quercetin dioxygenase-like cupin family protein